MRRNYVVGFAFSADRSKVALIRKNRPAWQAGKLNGIGGKFLDGEEALACMCREFQEETGVTTRPEDWHYFTKMIGRDGDIFFYRMFSDKMLHVSTKTDEIVTVAEVDYNYFVREGVSNLVWLVGIALDDNQPEFFVETTCTQDFAQGKVKAS